MLGDGTPCRIPNDALLHCCSAALAGRGVSRQTIACITANCIVCYGNAIFIKNKWKNAWFASLLLVPLHMSIRMTCDLNLWQKFCMK